MICYDKLQVVIVVEGGMVQNVYANGSELQVHVIDLDVSDYPDDDEIEEKENNVKELEEIRKSGSFQCVW